MSIPLDIKPFPLGAIAPTSGTPLPILDNFSTLAATHAKSISFFCPSTNSGLVYVGRSTMNRTTWVGVIDIVPKGETKVLLYDITGLDATDLTKLYVDVDTTGDKVLVSILVV